MTNDFQLRVATDDDYDQLTALVSGVFLHDPEDDQHDWHRMVFEAGRTHVVSDDGALVGTGAIFTRELSVPGAVIPAAHVTGVAVASTHRRRGLLTSVMTTQLKEVRSQGTEPVAVLWASEGSIYGRFGYGLASWRTTYEISTPATTIPGGVPDGVRLRLAAPGDVVAEMAAVLARVLSERPGLSSRPGRWWDYIVADPKSRRRGMSSERAVLYETDGHVRGYVMYRTKLAWGDAGPAGELRVSELVAETPEAYAALWRYVLSIDLVRSLTYEFNAVDDPLPYLVSNPDGMVVSSGPALWVRIVDVAAALSARRYAAPVDVVLDLSDAGLPANAGRWRLTGDHDSAWCEPIDAEADLRLDIRELASAYLGGVSLSSLAAAGLVTELRPGTVATTSSAFGWHRAPTAVEIF